MRNKKRIKNKTNFTLLIFLVSILLFISSFIFQFSVCAQEEDSLNILITSVNYEPISEIEENTYFKISVYNSTNVYLSNVTITFNGREYRLDDEESLELEIHAPEVDKNTVFEITASKPGYNTVNSSITVLNTPVLVITHYGGYVVDAGERFSVKVTEDSETGEPVQGATVAIQNVIGTETITDEYGRAFLTAPKNKEKIIIIATKPGYQEGKQEIEINPIPDIFRDIVNSKYFLIFIAVLILILSIVFVHYRQRRYGYVDSFDGSSKEKTVDRSVTDEKDGFHTKNMQDVLDNVVKIKSEENSKIEEIRIIQPKKDKEHITIRPDEKVSDKKTRELRDSDWFHGIDEIRYEIDRLTGEIDEEGKDKWFEGIESIRDKIDEKMKKKDKKKDEDNGKKE